MKLMVTIMVCNEDCGKYVAYTCITQLSSESPLNRIHITFSNSSDLDQSAPIGAHCRGLNYLKM